MKGGWLRDAYSAFTGSKKEKAGESAFVQEKANQAVPDAVTTDMGASFQCLEVDKLAPACPFPNVVVKTKPYHKNFIPEKRRYVSEAFMAIYPYYNFAIHLEPISCNDALADALRIIIENFIALYWDMPSSKEHHDNRPFGHVVHSLDVACREAKAMCQVNLYNDAGLDSEQTRKQRPILVVAGFIIGLLHDASKILNYDLQSVVASGAHHYSPFSGSASILEFLLKYPTNTIRKSWKLNPNPNLEYWIQAFYALVPQKVRIRMSGEVLEMIYTRLRYYKSTADHLATSQSLQDGSYSEKVAQCLHEVLMEPAVNRPDGWAFKLDPNWYLIYHNQFIARMCRSLRCAPESLELFLHDSGLMPGRKYGERVDVVHEYWVYPPQSNDAVRIYASLLRAPFIEEALAKTSYGSRVEPYGYRIVEPYRKVVDALGLEPALDSTLYRGIAAEPGPSLQSPVVPSGPPGDVEISATTDFDPVTGEVFDSVPDPAPVPDIPMQITAAQPSAPVPEALDAPAAASPNPDKPPVHSGPKEPPDRLARPASIIKTKGSGDLFLAKEKIATAVLECLANAIGIKAPNVPGALQFQPAGASHCVFVLTSDARLLGRWPQTLKTSWKLFDAAVRSGSITWASDISARPAVLDSGILSKNIISYMTEFWGQRDVLLRTGSKYTFDVGNLSVVRVKGFSNGQPIRETIQLQGTFCEIDQHALEQFVTGRLGKATIAEAIEHFQKLAYE